MANLLAEYKMGGISFFIPCSDAECEFLKDVKPVDQTPEQNIDEALSDITNIASSINNEDFEQHDDWYNRMHDFNELNHIPETYK